MLLFEKNRACIYIYTHISVNIYIYIYIERKILFYLSVVKTYIVGMIYEATFCGKPLLVQGNLCLDAEIQAYQ